MIVVATAMESAVASCSGKLPPTTSAMPVAMLASGRRAGPNQRAVRGAGRAASVVRW